MAELQAGESTYGVRFRPGAFTALYGVPAGELADMRLPLADVVRRPRKLLEIARDAERPDPLATAALYANDVRGLALETGYSERHLHRRVLALTGHSPKRLARIGRMQALLAAGRGENWAQTAARFGYSDESHMINDVRRLADATPHALLPPAPTQPPHPTNPKGHRSAAAVLRPPSAACAGRGSGACDRRRGLRR